MIISTAHPSQFYAIIDKYKKMRDDAKEEEKPKLLMKKNLYTEFVKFKSK